MKPIKCPELHVHDQEVQCTKQVTQKTFSLLKDINTFSLQLNSLFLRPHGRREGGLVSINIIIKILTVCLCVCVCLCVTEVGCSWDWIRL